MVRLAPTQWHSDWDYRLLHGYQVGGRRTLWVFWDTHINFSAIWRLRLPRWSFKIICARILRQNVVNRPGSQLRFECALITLLNLFLQSKLLDFSFSLLIPCLLIIVEGFLASSFCHFRSLFKRMVHCLRILDTAEGIGGKPIRATYTPIIRLVVHNNGLIENIICVTLG